MRNSGNSHKFPEFATMKSLVFLLLINLFLAQGLPIGKPSSPYVAIIEQLAGQHDVPKLCAIRNELENGQDLESSKLIKFLDVTAAASTTDFKCLKQEQDTADSDYLEIAEDSFPENGLDSFNGSMDSASAFDAFDDALGQEKPAPKDAETILRPFEDLLKSSRTTEESDGTLADQIYKDNAVSLSPFECTDCDNSDINNPDFKASYDDSEQINYEFYRLIGTIVGGIVLIVVLLIAFTCAISACFRDCGKPSYSSLRQRSRLFREA